MGLPRAAQGNKLICQQLFCETSHVSLLHHHLTCSNFSLHLSSKTVGLPLLSTPLASIPLFCCPQSVMSQPRAGKVWPWTISSTFGADRCQNVRGGGSFFWGYWPCSTRAQLWFVCFGFSLQGSYGARHSVRPALLIAPNAHVNVSAFVLNTPVLTGQN